jgi:hypothetical protein
LLPLPLPLPLQLPRQAQALLLLLLLLLLQGGHLHPGRLVAAHPHPHLHPLLQQVHPLVLLLLQRRLLQPLVVLLQAALL